MRKWILVALVSLNGLGSLCAMDAHAATMEMLVPASHGQMVTETCCIGQSSDHTKDKIEVAQPTVGDGAPIIRPVSVIVPCAIHQDRSPSSWHPESISESRYRIKRE